MANLLFAAIFWPMLQEHWEKIRSGEKKALIEIRMNK
jgi:hypothetical protein